MSTSRNTKHPMEAIISPTYLENRTLILNEYDNDGNLIDSRELSDWHLKSVLSMAINYGKSLDVLTFDARRQFTENQWQLITFISRSIHEGPVDLNATENIEFFTKLLEEPEEKLRFAATMPYDTYKHHIPNLETPYCWTTLDLFTGLEYVNSHSGIYYAVNNSGQMTYNFVDAPTRKQAKYRRTKYGDRIVFLCFNDWVEYAVKEDELG